MKETALITLTVFNAILALVNSYHFMRSHRPVNLGLTCLSLVNVLIGVIALL